MWGNLRIRSVVGRCEWMWIHTDPQICKLWIHMDPYWSTCIHKNCESASYPTWTRNSRLWIHMGPCGYATWNAEYILFVIFHKIHILWSLTLRGVPKLHCDRIRSTQVLPCSKEFWGRYNLKFDRIPISELNSSLQWFRRNWKVAF